MLCTQHARQRIKAGAKGQENSVRTEQREGLDQSGDQSTREEGSGQDREAPSTRRDKNQNCGYRWAAGGVSLMTQDIMTSLVR